MRALLRRQGRIRGRRRPDYLSLAASLRSLAGQADRRLGKLEMPLSLVKRAFFAPVNIRLVAAARLEPCERRRGP